MIDDEFVKEYLHSGLCDVRATMLWKLEGFIEYDVRRPLTSTGTNLLGLVKHLSITEAWYFGGVFGRPCPEPLPWRNDAADERSEDAKVEALFTQKLEVGDMWAREDEPRDRRPVQGYVEALGRDDRGPRHQCTRSCGFGGHARMLFNILIHVLAETYRHAEHADILREQLDGAVGTAAGNPTLYAGDKAFWDDHRTKLERAAKAAGSH